MVDETRTKAFCPECGAEYERPDIECCPRDGARLREIKHTRTDEDPLVGGLLDERFRVESVLGQGGMGRVYVGEQLSVDRPVAIKTLRPEMNSEEVITKRFMRESQVISKFSHPNIVNLIDFGRADERDILYLVLELVDGMAIDELVGERRLVPKLALHIVDQLCGGLYAVHSEGVIHRDLKPENVMVVHLSDGHLEAKLLDFGVAHALREPKNLTASGSVLGTPYYMAPEQAHGREVGPPTDVYSLGIILFEMLTGSRPVTGDSVMEILLEHAEDKVPRLGTWDLPNDFPDGLAELVEAMTENDPDDRPQTMREVRQRIGDIRAEADWDEVVVDPSESLEAGIERWLKPALASPDHPADTPSEGATGDRGTVPGTDDPDRRASLERTDGSTSDGQQIATAETKARPGQVDGQQSDPTAPPDGGAPNSAPSRRRQTADSESDFKTEDARAIVQDTFGSVGTGTVIVGLIAVLGAGGVAGYFLFPDRQTTESRAAADEQTAASGGAAGDESAPGVAGTADAGVARADESAPGTDVESTSSPDVGGADQTGEPTGGSKANEGERAAQGDSRVEKGAGQPAGGAGGGSAGSDEEAPTAGDESTDSEPEGSTSASNEASSRTSASSESIDESASADEEPSGTTGNNGASSESATDEASGEGTTSDDETDPGFFPAE